MRPSPRWLYTVRAVVVLGLIASFACRSERDRSTLTLLVAKDPEALDPRFASSQVAVQLSHLIFAPLFFVGEDLQATPYLAERLERPDELTYEVVLRENIRFHDGTPLTAADVAFTYGQLGDDDVRSLHAGKFENLARVEVVDARRVRFVLKKPWAAFPIELCALGIVPATCAGRTAECRKSLVGAGAYAVEAFDQASETLTLRAHKTFVLGAPGIPRIRVRVVRNQTTRLLELIDDNADLIIGDLAPSALDALQRAAHLNIARTPGLGYSYLAFNLRGPKATEGPEDDENRTRRALAHPKVRRAVAHALNLDQVINTKLRGAAVRTSGMLPKGHWAKDETLPLLAHDPQRAAALLDEAGFPRRDDGTRFRVTLNTTPNRLRKSIALLFQYQMKQVGIDVQLRVAEWSTLYQEIKRGNFEMFSAQWTPIIEPDLMSWTFHSRSIPSPGSAGGNRGAYRNATVDALIDAGKAQADLAFRRPFYTQAEAILADDLPYVPMWFEDLIAVVHRRILGFELLRTGSLLPLYKARFADGDLAATTSGTTP